MFSKRAFANTLNEAPSSAGFAREEMSSLAPLPALNYLSEWLPQDEAVYADAASLLLSLETLDPICRDQLDAAVVELLDGLATPLRTRMFTRAVLPFTEVLLAAHRRGLQAWLTASGDNLPAPHAGLLHWWAERMLANFVASRRLTADDWSDLHIAGAALIACTLPTEVHSAAKLALARLVLISTGLSAEADVRQAYILGRLAGWCAPFVSLSAEPMGRLCYLLDLAANIPPTRWRRHAAPTTDRGLLFADLDQVIAELGQLERFVLQYARLPKNLAEWGLGTAEVLTAVRRLRDRWCGRPHTRRFRRRPLVLDVEVASDFAGIRTRLPGPGRAAAAAERPELVHGRVTDVSQGGSGVMVEADGWAQVGAGVGLHVGGTRHWMLGVVRRTVNSAEDRTLLGVDVLALTPQSVQLREEGEVTVGIQQIGQSEPSPSVHAIWIPPSPHNGREAMLWVESPEQLQVGKHYRMQRDGELEVVRVMEVSEVGSNFVCFRVAPEMQAQEVARTH